MINRLRQLVLGIIRRLAAALAQHPVEMLVALHAYIVICTLETSETYPFEIAPWMRPALLAPVFFVTAYCLGATLRRGRLRIVYYLWLLPYAATTLYAGIEQWATTTQYVVTNIGLLPLLLVSFRMRRDNTRFVAEAVHTFAAAGVGVVFAAVTQLLFWLTYMSVIYIFDLHEVRHMGTYSAFFSFVVLAPMIFFAVEDGTDTTYEASGTTDMLLNWIVAPALLIYTAILYLYAAKILVLWSLPKGGVANMIFAFTIAAVAVKALQQFVGRRRYDRYFDRFSLIALPLAVLFWVGSLRRVVEYGLTEWRYYMILCGAVMTLCIVLFLSRRTGRYLTVAVAAFVLLVCSTFVPPLKAERMALDSQVRRARKAARELAIVAADGTLRLGEKTEADVQQRDLHRRLYQSLVYIGSRDSERLAREFGIASSNDYLASLSSATEDYVLRRLDGDFDEATAAMADSDTSYYIYYGNYQALEPSEDIPIEGYRRMLVRSLSYERDSKAGAARQPITVGDRRIDPDALLDSMLSSHGFSRRDMPSGEWLDKHAKEFLTYRGDSVLIVFEDMSLSTVDGAAVIERADDFFTAIK